MSSGVVITKYDHSNGPIGNPIVDHNALKGTTSVLEITGELGKVDHAVFLVSGGGSELFGMPMDGFNWKRTWTLQTSF